MYKTNVKSIKAVIYSSSNWGRKTNLRGVRSLIQLIENFWGNVNTFLGWKMNLSLWGKKLCNDDTDSKLPQAQIIFTRRPTYTPLQIYLQQAHIIHKLIKALVRRKCVVITNEGFMSEVACYLHNLPNGDVTSQYLMNVPTQNVCDTMGKHQPLLSLNFMFFADSLAAVSKWNIGSHWCSAAVFLLKLMVITLLCLSSQVPGAAVPTKE